MFNMAYLAALVKPKLFPSGMGKEILASHHRSSAIFNESKFVLVGYDKNSLPAIREWVCPVCGTKHDRDINAAKNILAEGLRKIA